MSDRVPLARINRGRALGKLAAGQAVRTASSRLSMIGRSEQARALLAERSTLQAADQLVTVLGSLKGSAMKLGQLLSMLEVDMVPEAHRERFRQKLARLRDQAPREPFSVMRPIIESNLGALSKNFRDFDETPVAAASIGQVYRAVLLDGREVAVKVKYPGVDEAVRADMQNLALFTKFWRKALPTLSNSAFMDEISMNLESELDYPREARTQHEIAERYRGHPFIVVPDCVPELCTSQILVTEFLDGQAFPYMQTLPEDERNRIGELIFRFYIGSLFQDNDFCGDPHPGNILLAADGTVGFVDFGLYNRMNPEHVDFERHIMRAATEGRAQDMYDAMVARGIIDPEAGVSPQDCLEYCHAASGWNLVDEDMTITPEIASSAMILAVDPRSSEFAGMRRQNLPPEHIFSRRADFYTFGVLGQLNVTGNWHRIAREWIYGEPPATELGIAIAQWRACR
ncbi:ABC1 kinase family protein [Mycobacteroides abscessus]|uniref:ABC1 kinase family protein n=1 Tax=Mycobacteroides abscessus TaxID=36809 RepID=UPI0009A6B197|nr:AarF/ABC1/UbiB kinase family protein [Mycobacteroides abscessus]SLF86382.1 Putative ATP-binding protein [Mycobacteroides abscessus subsp. abscessus]